jgi:Spx/MgsR family transcriptional regulator
MTTTLYGLKNCDTCRKARAWLDQQGHSHRFHDFRADGLDAALLARFEAALGWEALLNRRGTTWRGLPEADRDGADRDKALALMLAHPALIKRPVLVAGDEILVGFSADQYTASISFPRSGVGMP